MVEFGPDSGPVFSPDLDNSVSVPSLCARPYIGKSRVFKDPVSSVDWVKVLKLSSKEVCVGVSYVAILPVKRLSNLIPAGSDPLRGCLS